MKTTTSSLSVSVALCTCNGEKFLQEQLDSLAAQTRLPDEVFVCDDVSSDQTVSILKQWASSVPFSVRIVQNPENLGFIANFEQTMRLCTHDVIFFCDQDDVWRPQKIEKMVREFEKDPDLNVVFGEGEMIDAHGTRLGVPRWIFASTWIQYCEPSYVAPHVRENRLMAGCCMAFRRDFLSVLLPLPPQMTHDSWIYYLSAALPKYVYLRDEPLIFCRMHEKNVSIHQQKTLEETLAFHDKTPFHRPATSVGFYWSAQKIASQIRERLPKIPDNPNKRRLLKMLDFNDRHYPNRSRIQRCFLLFFPLFFLELVTFRYFRRPQPVGNIMYDLWTGMKNSFRPAFLFENGRKLLQKLFYSPLQKQNEGQTDSSRSVKS